jgi:hypothetical protein
MDIKIFFLIWWLRGDDLYVSVKGFCFSRQERPCILIKEVIVWLEAIIKAMV